MRTFSAGRYRKIVRYPRALPGDSPTARQAKRNHSAAAQRYINIRDCTERLQWLLCCNFDVKSAAFLTLTFDDAHLPASRAAVKERMRKLIRQLRPVFRMRGEEFPVIYTVEGQPHSCLRQADTAWEVSPWRSGDKWEALDDDEDQRDEPVRLHAHAFLLLPEPDDRELVRSFWPFGRVHVNYIRVNDPRAFPRLAAYVTKESRMGVRPDNERAYVPSLGLVQPQVDGHWCEEAESIGFPAGVERLGDGHTRDYATQLETEWIMYRHPRPTNQPTLYQSKGRISGHRKYRKTKQTATR